LPDRWHIAVWLYYLDSFVYILQCLSVTITIPPSNLVYHTLALSIRISWRLLYIVKKHPSSISERFKSYFMGSKGEATGNDVTESHVTGSGIDRKWRYRKRPWLEEVLTGSDRVRIRNRFPRFSTYSSSTKYTIAHDRHSYRMWHDPWRGVSRERVRACATGNCAISALVGPFHQTWRNQTCA
jgi:hypothetical protein